MSVLEMFAIFVLSMFVLIEVSGEAARIQKDPWQHAFVGNSPVNATMEFSAKLVVGHSQEATNQMNSLILSRCDDLGLTFRVKRKSGWVKAAKYATAGLVGGGLGGGFMYGWAETQMAKTEKAINARFDERDVRYNLFRKMTKQEYLELSKSRNVSELMTMLMPSLNSLFYRHKIHPILFGVKSLEEKWTELIGMKNLTEEVCDSLIRTFTAVPESCNKYGDVTLSVEVPTDLLHGRVVEMFDMGNIVNGTYYYFDLPMDVIELQNGTLREFDIRGCDAQGVVVYCDLSTIKDSKCNLQDIKTCPLKTVRLPTNGTYVRGLLNSWVVYSSEKEYLLWSPNATERKKLTPFTLTRLRLPKFSRIEIGDRRLEGHSSTPPLHVEYLHGDILFQEVQKELDIVERELDRQEKEEMEMEKREKEEFTNAVESSIFNFSSLLTIFYHFWHFIIVFFSIVIIVIVVVIFFCCFYKVGSKVESIFI